ncbi:MAG: hypothetical protein R6X08_00625 [Desulfosalsimonadaceae bacterium]
MKDKALQIEEKIRGRLENGIRLGSKEVHYIESVAGIGVPKELLQQLDDTEGCESRSLYELIFYPGRADQVVMEEVLESEAIEEEDLRDIGSRLKKKRIRTRIVFPDQGETGEFEVPQEAVSSYVKRLNLDRCIPEKLSEAVGFHIKGRDRLLVRVGLRNAEFEFKQNIVSFLCSYLEQVGVGSEEDMAQLDWVIGFLGQAGERTDIYTALMEEKRRAAEMLRRETENERRLSRQPVEALIMQGVNIACISRDEAVGQINIIDRIALAVFGRTEAADPEEPVNLGVFDARNDMDKVISILS